MFVTVTQMIIKENNHDVENSSLMMPILATVFIDRKENKTILISKTLYAKLINLD